MKDHLGIFHEIFRDQLNNLFSFIEKLLSVYVNAQRNL